MIRGKVRHSEELIFLSVRILDVFILLTSALLSYYWNFSTVELFSQYKALILAALPVFVIAQENFGIYRSWRGGNYLKMFAQSILSWIVVLGILVVSLFFMKISDQFSRVWLMTWAVTNAVCLVIFRAVLFFLLRMVRSRGGNQKNVLIFGLTPTAQSLIRQSQEAVWAGFNIVGLVDCEDKTIEADYLKQKTTHKIYKLEELEKVMAHVRIAECWIALPFKDEDKIHKILFATRHSTANIRLVPDISSFRLINQGITEIVGMPMLDLSASPMTGTNLIIKTIFDKVFAAFILVLILPLMLAIAAAIKLTSRGPVIFKQKRHGWETDEIMVYKFRSMYIHEEKDGSVTQATKHDVRLTRVGKFFRRTSLDELPQFYNVLQGRMSVVGPRPHAIAHNHQYKELIVDYMLRHKVKPGITGWAQVNGYRGETDTLEKMQKRVQFDLYYIQNWSPWFDIKIIVMTIFKGFIGKNVY